MNLWVLQQTHKDMCAEHYTSAFWGYPQATELLSIASVGIHLLFFRLPVSVCSRMEGGVFAVFGMKNISSLNVVQSLTRKFHMPYLSPSLSKVSAEDGSEFELHMKPSYTDAMIHLIMSYGWTSIYYIYDSDTGRIIIMSSHISSIFLCHLLERRYYSAANIVGIYKDYRE